MHPSTTAALASGQEATRLARDFAAQLRVQADVVDAVRERLRAAERIGWESPAGRNFRAYLADRAAGLATAAALLREAAVLMDGYSAGLDVPSGMNGSQL